MANQKTKTSSKRQLNRHRHFSWRNFISSLLILFTLGILFYPIIVNLMVSQQNVTNVTQYKKSLSSLGKAKAEQLLSAAKTYNEDLYKGSQGKQVAGKVPDYNQLLNVEKNGMMGYLSIPQIQLTNVPIYHGDSDKTLALGVGHIEQTSLPIGGVNTHTMLAAHSGRVNDALFTDLDTLKAGDVFYITVLNETLRYQVISTKIIAPEAVTNPTIERGKDLATLVTCWPTGVNNKRLLVTGKRVALDEKIPQATTERNFFGYNFWVMAGSGLLAVLALAWMSYWLLWSRLRLYHVAAAGEKNTMSDGTGDFGSGFYLTNSKKVARKWAAKMPGDAVISVYRLKKRHQLTRWIFKSKSENWQAYIDNPAKDKRHELIMGPLPNENYGTVKKVVQYALKSRKAIKQLKYIKTLKN